jgi:hypothetical protein
MIGKLKLLLVKLFKSIIHKNIFLTIFVVVALVFLNSISSEEKETKVKKFDGIISTSDKRLSELSKKDRKKISERLFFKMKDRDNLVFYDLNGHESFFQYRRNKFDYPAEDKVKGLFSGHEYLIKGTFLGLLSYYDSNKKVVLNPPSFLTLEQILEIEKKAEMEKLEKEKTKKDKLTESSSPKVEEEKKEPLEALYNPKFNKPVYKFISFESLIPEQIIR